MIILINDEEIWSDVHWPLSSWFTRCNDWSNLNSPHQRNTILHATLSHAGTRSVKLSSWVLFGRSVSGCIWKSFTYTVLLQDIFHSKLSWVRNCSIALKGKEETAAVAISDKSITAAISHQLMGIRAHAMTALTAVDHNDERSHHFTKDSQTLYNIRKPNAYNDNVLINCQNLKRTSER